MCKGRQLNQDTPYNLWILIWNIYGAKIEIKYNMKEIDLDLVIAWKNITIQFAQFGNHSDFTWNQNWLS